MDEECAEHVEFSLITETVDVRVHHAQPVQPSRISTYVEAERVVPDGGGDRQVEVLAGACCDPVEQIVGVAAAPEAAAEPAAE